MTQTKSIKKFNANEHLIELKHKQKQADGSYKDVTTNYLPVAWRIVWFREDHPDWEIRTEIVSQGDDFATIKATVSNELGRPLATAHKREDRVGWADFLEKAETGSLGRCLALVGYGTQFSPDLDEGTERIVDSPIEMPKKPAEPILEPLKPINKATPPQIRTYYAVAKNAGYDADKAKEMAKIAFKLESFTDITALEITKMITAMSKKVKEQESTKIAEDAISNLNLDDLDLTVK